MWTLPLHHNYIYDDLMLIKISNDDPLFEQAIQLLKLKYRTTAASKAAKRAIYEFYEIEQENEILQAQLESMTAEIDRLRELLEIKRSTRIRRFLGYVDR